MQNYHQINKKKRALSIGAYLLSYPKAQFVISFIRVFSHICDLYGLYAAGMEKNHLRPGLGRYNPSLTLLVV